MDWYVDRTQPRALQSLRREVGAYLRRHAVDPDDVPDAELAVDELLANAFEHGSGPVWLSLEWQQEHPVVTVQDLGATFDLVVALPDAPDAAEGGRGLYLVSHLTDELAVAAKNGRGKRVRARLRVRRPVETSFDPPPRPHGALPSLGEARPEGGFGKEAFLRALVVQLARAVETLEGPQAAEAAVAQVGSDVGWQMEQEYRLAGEIVGQLTPRQLGDCYVRLKAAIDGGFYLIEATPERVVLGNTACPFGPVVQRAPALCRMTSSVFGGIAARNAGGAIVVLEERIAVGDPECKVVVHLGPHAATASIGHRYDAAE